MKRRKLTLDSLAVTSFETSITRRWSEADTYPPVCACCTGCDSGCGILGSEVGCQSAGDSGDTCPPNC
ncbi:MAG TPA: hypothetical protein VF746_03825 [Longimicrobium sp.]|jgi:hypothetical protein